MSEFPEHIDFEPSVEAKEGEPMAQHAPIPQNMGEYFQTSFTGEDEEEDVPTKMGIDYMVEY